MNPQFSPMLIKWANAIKVWEGGPDATNPGDLKYSTLIASWGGTPGIKAADGGHLAHFPTSQAGFTALCNFLKLGCENELIAFHSPEARTLGGFMTIYGGNPPQGYLNGIAAALGVPLTTQISTFL
ncbi:MAG: hypothetical protein KGJ90_02060 [Patescibacteria group bacterium]|nr:hypothetical protein [Patescibacteria group bacterium]